MFLWHFLKLESYRSVFEQDILFSWLSFAHTSIHMLNNTTLSHSCFLVCWTRMQRFDSFKWWHMGKRTNIYRLSRPRLLPLISCEQTSWHFATYLDLYYAEGAASKTWSKVLSESGQQTYYGPAKIMTASVCPFTLKLLPFWKRNYNKITNQFGMCETWYIF